MLAFASLIAGVILMLMGLLGLGKLVRFVPHSIVVGFTIGIAVTIALSQVGEVLGMHAGFKLTEHELAELQSEGLPEGHIAKLRDFTEKEFATRGQFLSALATVFSRDELESAQDTILKKSELRMPHNFLKKLHVIQAHFGEFKGDALLVALVTLLLTQYLLKVSIYIPSPLIAIACGIGLSYTLHDPDLTTVAEKYGAIPTDFFVLTRPTMPTWERPLVQSIGYLVLAIVFVSGVESLLCSRMADRLADNRGTPFNPNKEFWGQGMVQVIVPLLNGFPHTGALARTATNIKVGAVTPLAGIFKCVLKLLLAFYLARYLELVPMACIGGILMWVAFNMVKPSEIRGVFIHGWFHVALMVYTAVAVIVTDFLTGVLTGMLGYLLLCRVFDRPASPESAHEEEQQEAATELVGKN
jgi:MFS superfamily sulfate permease-like transporter